MPFFPCHNIQNICGIINVNWYEYITLLKEDGELDALISDLLIGMKITPISLPEKGRQHGVDIAAVGIDQKDKKGKDFLFVVKQGNLTRSNWDSKVNSVRPSLNEINDVYINSILEPKYTDLPIKIVVATNGEIGQNVQINWKGSSLEWLLWLKYPILGVLDPFRDGARTKCRKSDHFFHGPKGNNRIFYV